MRLWAASTRYFQWMFTFLVAHPGPKLFCMESSLRSDVWRNDSTTVARVDKQLGSLAWWGDLRSLQLIWAGNLTWSGHCKLSCSIYDLAAQVVVCLSYYDRFRFRSDASAALFSLARFFHSPSPSQLLPEYLRFTEFSVRS